MTMTIINKILVCSRPQTTGREPGLNWWILREMKATMNTSSYSTNTVGLGDGNESSFECSLVQLSADIDFIYKDLTENLEFSMSLYRLALIQQFQIFMFYLRYKLST